MKPSEISFESQLEQSEAAFEQFARTLAVYRGAVVDAGLSEHLADQLVIHYHDILLASITMMRGSNG